MLMPRTRVARTAGTEAVPNLPPVPGPATAHRPGRCRGTAPYPSGPVRNGQALDRELGALDPCPVPGRDPGLRAAGAWAVRLIHWSARPGAAAVAGDGAAGRLIARPWWRVT